MKKLFIAVIVFIILTTVGITGYFGYTQVTQSKAASTVRTGTQLPSSFVNPFVEKPTSGFSSSPVVQTLFTEPTPAYQNPFGSTQSGNQSYQNPFEALR